jgi:glycosyltransferase involved in cell wall biosynthesis
MEYFNILLKCITNLDNEIDIEKSMETLIGISKSINECENYIIEIIEKNSTNKVILLNYIAAKLYESGVYNSVIPLLENALKYDSNNDDTLYNIGCILYELGENNLALNYLSKIWNKSSEILGLINELRFKIKKQNQKNKIIILDETFPNMASGFRIAEYSYYLKNYENSEVYSYIPSPYFEQYKNEYEKYYPDLAHRVHQFNPNADFSCSLFYMIFLKNAYMFLPIIEQYKIPFIFTLYAGGDFYLNDPQSDAKLSKVCKSPYLKKIIVNQKIGYEYLVSKKFISTDKIEYIFGVVTQQDYWKENEFKKKYYKQDKNTFDICFVAYKYIDKGLNKGYDTFIEVAKKLSKVSEDIRFHVVGGFDENDIEISDFRDKITFYGRQYQEFFPQFYSKVDILLSLERPFILHSGSFDGFPTTSAVQTALNGVAVFATDTLNQNDGFKNGEDIVILPQNIVGIVETIIYYYNNVDKLYELSKKCKEAFTKVYSMENQLSNRKKVIDELL